MIEYWLGFWYSSMILILYSSSKVQSVNLFADIVNLRKHTPNDINNKQKSEISIDKYSMALNFISHPLDISCNPFPSSLQENTFSFIWQNSWTCSHWCRIGYICDELHGLHLLNYLICGDWSTTDWLEYVSEEHEKPQLIDHEVQLNEHC